MLSGTDFDVLNGISAGVVFVRVLDDCSVQSSDPQVFNELSIIGVAAD